MLNSSQFTSLAASVEKAHLATAVSIFYLSQQIGLMVGASGSAALLRKAFRDALVKNLSNYVDHDKVSEFLICITFHSDTLVHGAKLPE